MTKMFRAVTAIAAAVAVSAGASVAGAASSPVPKACVNAVQQGSELEYLWDEYVANAKQLTGGAGSQVEMSVAQRRITEVSQEIQALRQKFKAAGQACMKRAGVTTSSTRSSN
jgi:hypothetical protein